MYSFMMRLMDSKNEIIMTLTMPKLSSIRYTSSLWKHWRECLYVFQLCFLFVCCCFVCCTVLYMDLYESEIKINNNNNKINSLTYRKPMFKFSLLYWQGDSLNLQGDHCNCRVIHYMGPYGLKHIDHLGPKDPSAILLYLCCCYIRAGGRTLNANRVILPNVFGNKCFTETRRGGYDGLFQERLFL